MGALKTRLIFLEIFPLAPFSTNRKDFCEVLFYFILFYCVEMIMTIIIITTTTSNSNDKIINE